MEWKQRYFIWNNRTAFERGTGRNVEISQQGISLMDTRSPGVYYTRICDSREEEMQWDRLRLKGDVPFPHEVSIAVYSSETACVIKDGNSYDIYDIIKDTSISIEEKDRLFQGCKQAELSYGENPLIHTVTGRYLWLRFQLETKGDVSPRIERIQLFFPKMSLTAYLPELYQNADDTFLDRYLEIFQSVYQDMNHCIEELPKLYSAGQTPKEWLVWLSQWIAVPHPYLWSEEQLRYLIRHGMELAYIRGTAEYLKRILWLYTDTIPYIVEYWHWGYETMSSGNRMRMERLYGADSYCVTVILREQAVKDRKQMSALESLVSYCTPAHMEARIEVLQPYIFLDRHSYLGINSRLGIWGDAVLDGQNFLPFVVLKDKEKQYEGL